MVDGRLVCHLFKFEESKQEIFLEVNDIEFP